MSTSPYTFADLSTAETQAMIRARLLAALAASGQPTTSWAPSSVGGLENTRLDMVSGGLAQWMAARYAAAVRGRLLLAAQDDPTLGYFLSYLGKKNYQLTRIQPTFTIKNFALVANDRASTTTYQPGQLVARSPATGNRYILNAVANVVAGTVVRGVPFIAENPGAAYADAEGTVTQLVTGKAGLSVQDSPEFQNGFRPTAATGASTGTVTGSVDPGNAPYSLVVIRIDSTGNVGVAGYSVSTDGGLTFVPRGVTSSLPTALPGGVGTLTFANGDVAPSFVAGSVFYLTVDSAFVQRGRDLEAAAAFQQACSNRWPALSLVPVKGTIELWARAASQEVTKVLSQANPNVPGGILVVLASQTGPASPAAQAAVQAFIQARLGFQGLPAPISPAVAGSLSPAETVIVSASQQLPVAVKGSVYVPRSLMASVQAGADLAWDAYVEGLPMGGNRGALVEMERFYELLGDLGAVDVQGLTLNGVAADLAIPRGFDAVTSGTLLGGVNWVPV